MNPKENCKSITTRSGIIVGERIGDNLVADEEEKNECEGEEEKEKEKKECKYLRKK